MSETRKPVLLHALAALTLLEGVGLVGATIYLVIATFAAPVSSVGTAIGLVVVAALAAVAVILLARATMNARPWIRGATVCIAVLQLLVAYNILIARSPVVAIALGVPALALLVLVFTPPVLRATMRPARDAEDDDRTF